MVWIREFDELPWEARKDTSTVVRYWPKIEGKNVTASAVAGEVTFTVHDVAGVEIQGSTNATPVKATGPLAGRTASNSHTYIPITIPAISTLGERYSVRILWQASGSSTVQRDVRLFDVVLYPFSAPDTSLSDMMDLRSDVAGVLDRMGQRLGFASGREAQEGAAGLCAYNGRLALDSRLRDQVMQDRREATSSETRAPVLGYKAVYARPALVLDRARLIRVERLEAMAHLYRSLAPAPDEGEDPMSSLYRHFRDAAGEAWMQVGPLAYDGSEDLVPETQLTNLGQVTRMQRVQS